MTEVDHEVITGPDGQGQVTRAEFVEAVEDQRVWILAKLRTWGRVDDAEDVMAAVRVDAWRALGRWAQHGRPKLAAWVNGVAHRTLQEWARAQRRYRADVFLEDLSAEIPATDPEPVCESALMAARVVSAIRERVMSRPGGTARWARLEKDAMKPTAGIRAREELLEELVALNAELSAGSGRKGEVA